MAEDETGRGTGSQRSGPRPVPMPMCPMAAMCGAMMDKGPSRFWLMLPGSVLILLGVLVVIEPAILAWLAGTAFVLFGIMMLMMAAFIRRLGVRLRNV